MECALRLREIGARVSIVWDDTDLFGNAPRNESAEIEELLSLLPADIPILTARDFPRERWPQLDSTAPADAMLGDIAIWMERGETNAAAFFQRFPQARPRSHEHLARVQGILAGQTFDWMLFPGGIMCVSPFYREALQRLGKSFTTFDSGKMCLMVSHNHVAGQQGDVPSVHALAWKGGHTPEEKRGLQIAEEELQMRIRGSGRQMNWQAAAATGSATERYDILVPLNFRPDAAALGVVRLFPDVAAWVTAIMGFVNAHPTATVAFRQHPGERLPGLASSDDVAALVQRLTRDPDRVRFVRADETLSTYDLLPNAKVVLPFTSSLGVEAATFGIPVITSTRCYYESMPFIWRGETTKDYFTLVERALAGELKLTAEHRREAAFLYYLTQRCNIMPTIFKAGPSGFREWVNVAPEELWQQPELQDLLAALLTRNPLGLLRHQRLSAQLQAGTEPLARAAS